MELWTERQATAHIAVPGVGRDAARSALKAGVAGRPVRVRNALLYEADAVLGVLERMDPPCEIVLRSGRPIFVARIASRTPDPDASWRSWRGADVLAPRSEQIDAVRGWWHLGERMENLLGGVGRYRGVPFVLGHPGPWFDDQLGRRFTTGPGGPFRLVHGRNRDLST